jgi:hypothetical protein
LLDEIKTLTYLIEDEGAVIKDLHTNLEQVKEYVISIIHEKDSLRSVGLLQDDKDNGSYHQIIIAKHNERGESTSEERGIKHHLENRVCMEQQSVTDNLGGNEIQILIENPTALTQHTDEKGTAVEIRQVIAVDEPNDSPDHFIAIDNPSVAHTGDNSESEVIAQHNLHPQGFQVLTDMIHVLLEENKNNPKEEVS